MSRNAGSRSSSRKAPPSSNPSSTIPYSIQFDIEKISIPIETIKAVLVKPKLETEQSPRKTQENITPKVFDKSAIMVTPKKNLIAAFHPSAGKQGPEASMNATGGFKPTQHTSEEPLSPKAKIREGSQRRDSKQGEKKPVTAIMTIDLNKPLEVKTTQIIRESSNDKTATKVILANSH